MPKVTPGVGETVEEVTRTRILPTAGGESEKLPSDSLEYMEAISMDKWQAGNHIVYLYRVDPPVYRGAPGPAYVTKYATPITLDQIQNEYGGGLWRILVKRGVERMADRNYQVTGTPRDLTRAAQEFNPAAPGGIPPAPDQNSLVSKAMDIASNPKAADAQLQMMLTASQAAIQLMANTAPRQMSTAELLQLAKELNPPQKSIFEGPLGTILIAAATTLVNRLITPTDPLAQLTQMAEIMSKFGGSSASDWKAALVSAAPQIAGAVRDTVHDLRMGTEAQMRMNAGRTLPAAPPPPPPAPPVAQNPATPDNLVQMPAAQPGVDPMQPFELKLVELLNDPAMTGDKAGEILDATWPSIVDEVSQYSVEQIMMAFRSRPLLAPHADNPRLREFLTHFLQWANETDAPPTVTPAKPAV